MATKKKAQTRSRLTLANCQIKSAEKFKAVCAAIDVLEKETFIRSGEIEISNCFICPDIDLLQFYNSDDPTEQLMAKICISIHVNQWGEDARQSYKDIVKKENEMLGRVREIHKKHAAARQ
jgi:hypothetical protein